MISSFFSLFAAECSSNGFFGLVPWYKYINDRYHPGPPETGHFIGCDLHKFTLLPGSSRASDVPLVLLAVVDDLLRVAGIVAVAFVLVGAVKYVASQGNPEDAASAQSTIINALIGLVISVVAVAFVSFLGSQLGS